MDEGGSGIERTGRLQVKKLTVRYSLGKTAVYRRMKALGIKPERIGNRSYVNQAQISLLDALHTFIQNKGTTAEFVFLRSQDLDASDT
ncbi:hypothetical protein [cf. Phormidesmis sp. LEGE 11477]|uniref:hypothetical protein n=1 Tax=cf. Phormidesmis sp. LEGE 11477 TaxID=1828680 RepID=UPI001880027F|nr:hypothetical protein [cf. Phormidesmis sp. LEGE 11477]MBE9063307.1 hypothetical protein [cf. Phormidesmis sp. LEGE 11477]